MTAREELIADLVAAEVSASSSTGRLLELHEDLARIMAPARADALIAEGWRKTPSREAIAQAIQDSFDAFYGLQGGRIPGPKEHDAADAILALMDGGNDE